jgi:hypothetical protein
MRRLSSILVLVIATVIASVFAAGCADVPVYARGKLAHPTMTTADLARPAEEHVRAVHEGAVGGGFTVGGGCGCN